MHNSPKDILENLLPVWLLVRTNLFIQSSFWTIYTLDNYLLLSALCSDKRRCILDRKLLLWNFLQISQLSIRSGAHNLFRHFLHIMQFLTAISRKLWRHLATKLRTVLAVLKGQWLLKKRWKQDENRPINSDLIVVQSISHSSERPARLSVTNKQTHIFAPQPARIVRSSPNFSRS